VNSVLALLVRVEPAGVEPVRGSFVDRPGEPAGPTVAPQGAFRPLGTVRSMLGLGWPSNW
jgi:hypothetical protein